MSKEDYIKSIDGAERRFFVAPVTVEKREDQDSEKPVVIRGYAALVNNRTSLPWFDEVIKPGAFDEVLTDDVRCLFNHDPNLILARTASGTLSLSQDDKGLIYEYSTPDRSYAKDLADAIERGDVSQSSFAFSIAEENWVWASSENEKDLREIVKFSRLYDVAPVTYPAYPDTEVGARSLQAAKEAHNQAKEKRNVVPFSADDAQIIVNQNTGK